MSIERATALWNLSAARAGAVAAVVGLVSGLAVLPGACGRDSPTAEITSPGTDIVSVDAEGTTVRGVVRDLSPGSALWLVTVEDGDETYRPQSRPCRLESDGRFACPALTIGEADDRGTIFRIEAVVVDARAASALADVGAQGDPRRRPGLRELPAGAAVVGERLVVRR